jgi:hypothetical protein
VDGVVAKQPQCIVDVPGDVKEVVHLVEPKVYAPLSEDCERDSSRWVLDTGASNHMSGSRGAFASIDSRTSGTVKFADGSVVKIEGVGIILYECKNGEHRALVNVYYIPRLTTSIISVGQLDEIGYEVKVKNGIMSIRDENDVLLARVKRSPGRLYRLQLRTTNPVCLSAQVGDDAWRWHSRFGHVNFNSLKKMASEEMVKGLPMMSHVEQLCEACIAGKHRRSSSAVK